MAKPDKVEVIRKNILRVTSKWTKDEYAFEDKRSEKAKKVSDLLSESSWGKSDKERLAEMLSLLSGEAVKVNSDEELEFAPLTALYVTKVTEKHKHSYETNSVIIHVGDGVCVNPEGKTGSPIPPVRDILRPATDEEIKAIPEAQIKGLMKEIQIVFAD